MDLGGGLRAACGCVWLDVVSWEEESSLELLKLWATFAGRSIETSSLEHFKAGSDNVYEEAT